MQQDKSHFDWHNPFYVFLLLAIILGVIILLLLRQSAPEEPAAGIEVAELASPGELERALDAPPTIETPPIIEAEPPALEQVNNPAPSNCSTDLFGSIQVNPQTGECLPVNEPQTEEPSVTDPAEEPEPPVVALVEEPELPLDPNILLRRVRQPFDLVDGLHAQVNSLTCQTIGEIVNASGQKDPEYVMENLRTYKDESLSLDELLNAIDRSIPYDLLIAWDDYLVHKQLKSPGEEIVDYFDSYQECSLEATIENWSSSPITFPDGCGFHLSRYVALQDRKGVKYSPTNFRQALCTKAPIKLSYRDAEEKQLLFMLPRERTPAHAFFDLAREGKRSVAVKL